MYNTPIDKALNELYDHQSSVDRLHRTYADLADAYEEMSNATSKVIELLEDLAAEQREAERNA